MKERLLLGIGNPGSEYAETRHNIAWMVLQELIRRHGGKFEKVKGIAAETADVRIKNARVRLIKPMTYVNGTGEVVPSLRRRTRELEGKLLVMCDDANLPLGRIRIRPRGSSGGHNGLKSLIEAFGHEEFARLRIGIDRVSGPKMRDHVLSRFGPEEREAIAETLGRAADAVECWALQGLQAAMNRYNRRPESEETTEGGKDEPENHPER